jgi:hypothetical protein
VVDHVVDRLGEIGDVVAVKGRDVLGVEQPVDLGGEAIALVLEVFDLLAADRGVRQLLEALLGQPGRLQRVPARLGEQAVELGASGHQRQPHRRFPQVNQSEVGLGLFALPRR